MKNKSYCLWTHREKVIARKYWQGNTFQAIGNCMGISRERIRQILNSLGINKSGVRYKKHNWKEKLGEWQYYNLFGLPQSIRKSIFERDKYTCQYCKGTSGDARVSIDHIIPRFKKGSHELDNLITACLTCNSRKGTKTLIEWIKNEKVKIST